MADRQSQGLQIALIAAVMLDIVFGVAAYLMWRQYDEARNELRTAAEDLRRPAGGLRRPSGCRKTQGLDGFCEHRIGRFDRQDQGRRDEQHVRQVFGRAIRRPTAFTGKS